MRTLPLLNEFLVLLLQLISQFAASRLSLFILSVKTFDDEVLFGQSAP